jgi:hypothetical protein
MRASNVPAATIKMAAAINSAVAAPSGATRGA